MSLKGSLALLKVEHAVFHYVPVRKRGDDQSKPTLMSEETPLDEESMLLLEERLRDALKSAQAYDVEFDPARSPIVRNVVTGYLSASGRDEFVKRSQELAQYLFTIQKGNNSPGLFGFLEGEAARDRAVAIAKLERQKGQSTRTRAQALHNGGNPELVLYGGHESL